MGQTDVLSPFSDADGPETQPYLAKDLQSKQRFAAITVNWPSVRGYELLSVIGCGGMGIVYKARQRDLNRIVALKMIRASVLEDPEVRQRFQTEAEAVAKLQHPNIIQVFEVGAVDATAVDGQQSPFISLEYVDGGSLEQHTGTPQSPLFAARMVEKLARATHAAHCVGVIHRDLKPANVLLNSANEPKIADFGIAKHIDDGDTNRRCVTQAGMVVGTPEYMAPEQIESKDATPAIDIYALGVILYELLTGRLPIQADNAVKTLELVRDQEPISPRMLQPNLPRDLETICLKCLQKSPERRYATADALADDLTRWLEGKPIHARPISRAERTIRWLKRNPTVAMLSVLVVLIAFMGLTGVLSKWIEAEANAAQARHSAGLAVERAASERWERYRSSIVAASSALQVHNAVAARRALEAAPPEHRNWEWYYLFQQLDVSNSVVPGRAHKEGTFHFTREGLHIGRPLGDDRGRICFWDAQLRKETHRFAIDSAWAGFALSDNCKRLAFVQKNRSIVIKDFASDEEISVLNAFGSANVSVSFSPNGNLLGVITEGQPGRVWDAATGRQILTLQGENGSFGEIVFSPDGLRLAAAGWRNRTVQTWCAKTGELLGVLSGFEGDVTRLFYSPDGSRLASIEDYPSYRLRLWDSATGNLVSVMNGHANIVYGLTFSKDGSRIASFGMDQTIRIWDGSTGKPIHAMRGHNGWVSCARFSADGKQVVSCAHDHTIRLWDPSNGSQTAVLHGHTGAVHSVAYLDDGESLVSSSADGSIRNWNLKELGRAGKLEGHTSFVYGVAIHADGTRAASASWDGTVRIWDMKAGRELRRIAHPKHSIATAVAYHPKGRFLASMSRDDAIYLWNPDTGQLAHKWSLQTHPFLEARMAFSPDGNLLASGCKEGFVRWWDVNTKAEVATMAGHTDAVRDVTFSADGRWLASGADANDKTVRIWDVANKKLVTVLHGHEDRVNTLAFSPDGKILATGSTDESVRLWDWRNGKQIAVLKHLTKIYGVTFTPDGNLLATACADNTIRLWAMASHQEVAELRGHSDYVHALAFTPNGNRLVSASGDFTLRTWDTRPNRGEPVDGATNAHFDGK